MLDKSRKVRVYRNLHKNCLSIQQDGLVKCHMDHVILRDFRAIVSKKGRERVLKSRRKNVHSYLEGYLVDNCPELTTEIYYNPYKTPVWIEKASGREVNGGAFVSIGVEKVLM